MLMNRNVLVSLLMNSVYAKKANIHPVVYALCLGVQMKEVKKCLGKVNKIIYL